MKVAGSTSSERLKFCSSSSLNRFARSKPRNNKKGLCNSKKNIDGDDKDKNFQVGFVQRLAFLTSKVNTEIHV